MEEFPRTKAGQPKKLSYRAGDGKYGAANAGESDKGFSNHVLASNIAKSYLALEEGDKENKRNLSNLVVDSSSGAIKYRGSVLTENARLKTLPQKSTPKLSHASSKLKRSDIASKSQLDQFRNEKEINQQNNQYKPGKRRTNFDQLTPTGKMEKPSHITKSPGSYPLSVLEGSSHYTSAFYTKKQQAPRDVDVSNKVAKNKSQGSINQSEANLAAVGDSRQGADKSPGLQQADSKRQLSLSGSKRAAGSSSKSLGKGRRGADVNLYETGTQVQVNRFDLEGSAKKVGMATKGNGYLVDSLKKVVIEESGVKRKRSQLNIDDLQDMFEDDKQFIESTKKIKERIESSNKKSQEDRILDYEPFNGKKLNFNDTGNVEESVREVGQVLLDYQGTGDSGMSTIPKVVSYEKLKAQKRPLKSVDFVSIKNNLRMNRLAQGDSGSRLGSPTRKKGDNQDGTQKDLVGSRLEKLFSNQSVRKLNDREQANSRGRAGLEEERDLENIFNKTSDAKFTFTETTSARMKKNEKTSFISSHKNSVLSLNHFKKKITRDTSSKEKLGVSLKSVSEYQDAILNILEDILARCKTRSLDSKIFKEYLSLALESVGWIESAIFESPDLSTEDDRSRKLVGRSLKVEHWAMAVMYYLITEKKNKINSLVAVYLTDLVEKVMKNFKFLLKTTRLSMSVSGLEDLISAEDLIDMLDFSTTRTQSILAKM